MLLVFYQENLRKPISSGLTVLLTLFVHSCIFVFFRNQTMTFQIYSWLGKFWNWHEQSTKSNNLAISLPKHSKKVVVV